MKDESKAKWPDGMAQESGEPNREVIFVVSDGTFLLEVYGDDGKNAAIARARQICALPRMVALLKEMTTWEWDDGYALRKIKNILRDIGEVE